MTIANVLDILMVSIEPFERIIRVYNKYDGTQTIVRLFIHACEAGRGGEQLFYTSCDAKLLQ